MKVKTLILSLIFLFMISCASSPEDENPYSPETIYATQLEFRIEATVYIEDMDYIDCAPPRHPEIGVYAWDNVTVGYWVDNQYIGEIRNRYLANNSHSAQIISPARSFQVDKYYEIRFRFNGTDIPPECQNQLGFRLTIKARALDGDFAIEFESLGWWTATTGFFTPWSVGSWIEYYIGTTRPYKFKVVWR